MTSRTKRFSVLITETIVYSVEVDARTPAAARRNACREIDIYGFGGLQLQEHSYVISEAVELAEEGAC